MTDVGIYTDKDGNTPQPFASFYNEYFFITQGVSVGGARTGSPQTLVLAQH